MNLKPRVPRTSPFRVLIALFVLSLTFAFGIYTEQTFAPTCAEQASVAADNKPRVAASSGRDEIDRIIDAAGARHGVDPRLIHAVIWKESNYRQYAESSRGARGLMQLTSDTARRFGCRDARDAAANVEAGTRYLRKLLERFDGDVRLALAGYNAGEGSVSKHRGIPPFPETQNFVRQIVARYGKIHHPLDTLASNVAPRRLV